MSHEKPVTVICTAADQAAARVLANDPAMFGVALSTTQGVTNPALATHFASSGMMSAELADALNVSLNPMLKVFDLKEGEDFAFHIAACDPPLYRIYEEL